MGTFLKAVGLLGLLSGGYSVLTGDTIMGMLTILAGAYLFHQGKKK